MEAPRTKQGVHARVLAQQFPPRDSCSGARLLLFRFVNPELSGHGSMFGHVSVALSAAFLSGRTLVIDHASPWPFSDSCSSTGGGCEGGFFPTYFQPLSSCSVSDISPAEPTPPLADNLEQEERVVVVEDDTALPFFRSLVPAQGWLGADPPESADQVPVAGALLRWIAALASLALRPSATLEALVAAEALQMGLPREYLGAHIRRGHKWVETAPRALGEYIEMLARCAEAGAGEGRIAGGERAVLVATEDQATIDLLAALNAAREGGDAAPETPAGVDPAEWGVAVREARGQRLRFYWTTHPRASLRISIPQAIRLGLLSAAEENRISLVSTENPPSRCLART
ncbi:hypothetical protein T484DRAFT_3000937 [Baffinella frigidus]|nr:hypothetical protein T484DRAFT_3000937 [Cryptophyta sp. CCMP2293]